MPGSRTDVPDRGLPILDLPALEKIWNDKKIRQVAKQWSESLRAGFRAQTFLLVDVCIG